MGLQIIRQPDGRYAVWSSIVDALLVEDATREDVAEWFARRAHAEAYDNAILVMGMLDRNERPYFQFTMTWDEVRPKGKT